MQGHISIAELEAKVAAIFVRAGLAEPQAAAMARTYVAAERDGCTSHGLYRIDVILRTIKAGKVDPQAKPELTTDESGIVRVNANRGYSSWAFEMGAPLLAERAKKLGIAALAVNDCVHVSALWPEVEMLARMGVAALAMCPSYATVAPSGGTKALLGTNPLAFAWPRLDDTPFVFDFATSMAARGEIELHRLAGKTIPEGWALDAQGQPTTNPEQALAGAMLPFGGHKGSAISIMIELLAAAMIGDLTSAGALDALGTTTLSPRHGELVLAFSPERFAAGRAGNPFASAEVLFNAITAQGARLPSSRRYAARRKSEAEGIPLSDEQRARLDRFLKLGLDAV